MKYLTSIFHQPQDRNTGTYLPALIARYRRNSAEQYAGLTVAVTPDTKSAVRLERVLTEFTCLPVTFFPDWETLPYDNFSPHQNITSAR